MNLPKIGGQYIARKDPDLRNAQGAQLIYAGDVVTVVEVEWIDMLSDYAIEFRMKSGAYHMLAEKEFQQYFELAGTISAQPKIMPLPHVLKQWSETIKRGGF